METIGKRDRDGVVDGLLESFGDAPSDAQRLRVAEDRKPQRWTPEEDEVLRVAVEKHGQRNWKARRLIAAEVPGRNHGQCQQRWNKVLKPGLVKGHWSEEEDTILKQMALQGCHSWTDVAAQIPGRTPKQCRERWRNHLDPSINRSTFTPEEDFTIQQAYEQMGNRWTKIAELVPGRTEDAVKTRWKALNPFRKTNDRPGRPRRMPDIDEVSTMLRPDNLTDAGLHQPGYAHAYDELASMLLSMVPSQPARQPTVIHSSETNTAVVGGSELPEPIVEPLHEDHNRIDSKDAAILRELLRSHTSSIMSFGSTHDASSFADISPDELLGSGELDEMLKAACQSRDGIESGTTSSATSAKALIKTLKNLSNSQEKHIFEELIDAVRAASGVEPSEDGSNRSLDFFSTSSGRDLLDVLTASGRNLGHSLDFDRSSIHTTSPELSALEGDDTDEDGDDDEDDDDLLRPIHIGKRSAAAGNDDGLSDLLKPIHLGKRTSFVGQPDGGF